MTTWHPHGICIAIFWGMKHLLTLALLLSSPLASAGDSPHNLLTCQQLLQRYDGLWRNDASEYFYRMHDRDLFWNLETKEADPEVSRLFLHGHSKASGIQTRIQVVKDNLVLDVHNLSNDHVLSYQLGPAGLVTHTEAMHFGTEGDDHNEINSLAFSARSYAYLVYPILQADDMVLALNVLPYQVDESFFVGKMTTCTAPSETGFWFNAKGEKFCFKPLARLSTSPD